MVGRPLNRRRQQSYSSGCYKERSGSCVARSDTIAVRLQQSN